MTFTPTGERLTAQGNVPDAVTAADGTIRSGLTLLVLHRAGDSWRIVQDASM